MPKFICRSSFISAPDVVHFLVSRRQTSKVAEKTRGLVGNEPFRLVWRSRVKGIVRKPLHPNH